MLKKKIVVFIPCCKKKYDSGQIEEYGEESLVNIIPDMWKKLEVGRKHMEYCIKKDSGRTSALHLYKGALYSAIRSYLPTIVNDIKSGEYKLYIISAGYGVVNALEPINNYDETLEKTVAKQWRENNLEDVIAEIIVNEKALSVFGFFAGSPFWSGSGSKYRYFFTEGLKQSISQGSELDIGGCFYRNEGRGVTAILGSLGRTFVDLINNQFDNSFINNIEENFRVDGNVEIGFDRIK